MTADLATGQRTEDFSGIACSFLNRCETTSSLSELSGTGFGALGDLDGALCAFDVSFDAVNLGQFSSVKATTLRLGTVNDVANLHGEVSFEFLLTLQK